MSSIYEAFQGVLGKVTATVTAVAAGLTVPTQKSPGLEPEILLFGSARHLWILAVGRDPKRVWLPHFSRPRKFFGSGLESLTLLIHHRDMLPLSDLRAWFTTHQRRLCAGDALPTLTDIAQRAGVHRDSIYSMLEGNRICARTQYALSRVIQEVDAEGHSSRTRVMSVVLGPGGPRLAFGGQATRILGRR